MQPEYRRGAVVAFCPKCKAVTSFEGTGGHAEEPVRVMLSNPGGAPFHRIIWLLLKCAGCGRGGLAEVAAGNDTASGKLLSFFPRAVETVSLPKGVPDGVLAEFREAEECIASGTSRAASALLRSALEKTLRANGYQDGSLAKRIDDAATDTVITAARARKAHENVRVLGNDVVHDDWRAVSEDEVAEAHHYVQRIIEDLYDDRASVERLLKEKSRIA